PTTAPGSGSAPGSSTSADSGPTPGSTVTTAGPGDDASTGDESSSTGFNFVDPDQQPPIDGCDQFAQDCPEGEKCTPAGFENEAGWSVTRCVPVAPEPATLGEPCTVEGAANSGMDNCDIGTMCWSIDPDTLQGECVGLCEGDIADPTCADPNAECIISSEAILTLCIPQCDPLQIGACGDDQLCVPTGSGFVCAPDESQGGGALWDDCAFINACDDGLLCAPTSAFCDPDAEGCCTPYCDLTSPSCPEGLPCTPFFPEDGAPPAFEDVGVCIVPAP
ncbi:MAG: hypothetical protein AAGA54_12500, partial [Myxococcota bacterium]